MNSFSCLVVVSNEKYLASTKIFLTEQYNITASEYCTLANLQNVSDIEKYNLLVITTNEITGLLINKLKTLKCQIFFLLVLENNYTINLGENPLYLIRPPQYEAFIEKLILSNDFLVQPDKWVQTRVNEKRLKIFDKHGHKDINLNKIIRLSANGAYTDIVTEDHEYLNQSHHLKYYGDKLDDTFFRVSYSHIVNANFIADYSTKRDSYIEMDDNFKIKISARYRKILSAIIDKYQLTLTFFISFFNL